MKLSNLRAEMEGREQSMYALQVDYLLINATIGFILDAWGCRSIHTVNASEKEIKLG